MKFITVYFQSIRKTKSPTIDGYRHRFSPGLNQVPEEHWLALCNARDVPKGTRPPTDPEERKAFFAHRQGSMFRREYIDTGLLRTTAAPPPALRAVPSQLPPSLGAFAPAEAEQFIRLCTDPAMLRAWAESDSRPQIQAKLYERFRELQPTARSA